MDDHALAAQIAREAGHLLMRRRAEGATKAGYDAKAVMESLRSTVAKYKSGL